MAKQRLINTRFWDDSYISNLDPIEKLMFIYFLTNPQTNICGIYELSIKKIALDTGIDKDMVNKVLNRFTKDKRIFYIKGWVCVKNFARHQNNNSPKVKIGIENELTLIPSDIMEKAIGYGYGIDMVSHLNLIKSNLIKSNKEAGTSPADWLLEDKLREMEQTENSHLDIIATFIREKSLKIENPKQLSAVIGRYSRIAKTLSGAYPNPLIIGAIDKIVRENKRRAERGDAVDWTLETVLKTLTK